MGQQDNAFFGSCSMPNQQGLSPLQFNGSNGYSSSMSAVTNDMGNLNTSGYGGMGEGMFMQMMPMTHGMPSPGSLDQNQVRAGTCAE